jgi:DNA-binding MarR family transcriptional regulator
MIPTTDRPPAAAQSPAELMIALQHALRAIQATTGGDRTWVELQLSMAQLKALALVVHTGGVTGRSLAARLSIGASAVTPLVDRLAAQKLVRRESDPDDRRVAWIRPTPKALALWEKLQQTNRTVLTEILDALPSKDRDRVHQALALLLDAAHRVLARHQEGVAR